MQMVEQAEQLDPHNCRLMRVPSTGAGGSPRRLVVPEKAASWTDGKCADMRHGFLGCLGNSRDIMHDWQLLELTETLTAGRDWK